MVTIDTNIAIYALTQNPKMPVALGVLADCSFLSVQVLNEYASTTVRKRQRSVEEARQDLGALIRSVGFIAPIALDNHHDAFRISDRYQLSFYDALLIAVALANGATTLYSEDMHHGLVVDGKLAILDPFCSPEPK